MMIVPHSGGRSGRPPPSCGRSPPPLSPRSVPIAVLLAPASTFPHATAARQWVTPSRSVRIIYAPPLVRSRRVFGLDVWRGRVDTCRNQSDMSDWQVICGCYGLLIRYTAGSFFPVKQEKEDSHVF